MSIRPELLQACIITLDEADNISACLESLSGLVDSVLVYDTGSHDETLGIAGRCGAKTVQGYWDDDFAAARNRALELCNSEWILSIDADEVLYCKVENGIRRLLLDNGYAQAFEVNIRNVLVADSLDSSSRAVMVGSHGEVDGSADVSSVFWSDAPAVTHPAVRLFRREEACWSGRLHERVVSKIPGRQLLIQEDHTCEIIHFGYAISRADSKKKAERNLKLAILEESIKESINYQMSGYERAIMLLKIGKARWAANQLNEALEDLLAAASADDQHGVLAWMALKSALQVALWMDDADKAIELYGQLNAEFPPQNYPSEGLPWNVLSFIIACIMGVIGNAGSTGYDSSEVKTTGNDAKNDGGAGSPNAAGGDRADGESAANTGYNRSVLEIAAKLDTSTRRLVVAQALNIGKNCANSLLEGAYKFFQGEEEILATLAVASRIAPRLDIDTARRWSQRMRSMGLSELCPLMAIARDADNDYSMRVHAATVAFSEFGDPEAAALLKALS